MESSTQHIILFDGVCNLCTSSVQFIIKRDREKIFRFASLQSEFGQQFLASRRDIPEKLDSIVYLENDKVYIKSPAVLKILHKLGRIYSFSVIFWIIPRFLRDAMYDLIARKRYRWFGKKEICMVPTPDLKERFLE
jgi:predicted DCC family thiol-disulfide oxidoreductase YuxK